MKQINWGWTVQRIDGGVGSSIGSAGSGQPNRYQTTKRLGIRHLEPPEKLIAGGRIRDELSTQLTNSRFLVKEQNAGLGQPPTRRAGRR
jgi:hypothetical protein